MEKNVASHFETEDSQEVSERKESEAATPLSPTNMEDSQPKEETKQDEAETTGPPTIFSYDQVKAKSENPVTGIDFKRREVSHVIEHFHKLLNAFIQIK